MNLGDSLQCVTIVNSEGLMVSDARPQARLRATATAEENGKRVTGSDNAGGRVGMTFYRTAGTTPKEIGEAGRRRRRSSCSRPSDPAPGEQPVVLGNFHSGVMVHEAVGHPLEADGNWQKTSIMWDKLGQMVANPMRDDLRRRDHPPLPRQPQRRRRGHADRQGHARSRRAGWSATCTTGSRRGS